MARGVKARVGIILQASPPYSFAPNPERPDELIEGAKCIWVDDEDLENLLQHNEYGPEGRKKMGIPTQEVTLDKASYYKMVTVPGVYKFKMGWMEIKSVKESNGTKKETIVPKEVPVEILEYLGEMHVKIEKKNSPKTEKF